MGREYLAIINPLPPMTCGTQKMPSVKPMSVISMTSGIPVRVLIQNTVAAKSWMRDPMKPISCQRDPNHFHCWTGVEEPEG